jgi:hypothetical protein
MAHHAHFPHHAHHTRRGKVLGHGSPVPLPAGVSAALRSLYREYEAQGGSRRFVPGQPGGRPLLIRGTRVAVQVKAAFPPAFDAYLHRFRAAGLKVLTTTPAHGLAKGMLPIAALPAAAQLAAFVRPAPPPIRR